MTLTLGSPGTGHHGLSSTPRMTERNFLADRLPSELILHSASTIVTKPTGFVGVL